MWDISAPTFQNSSISLVIGYRFSLIFLYLIRILPKILLKLNVSRLEVLIWAHNLWEMGFVLIRHSAVQHRKVKYSSLYQRSCVGWSKCRKNRWGITCAWRQGTKHDVWMTIVFKTQRCAILSLPALEPRVFAWWNVIMLCNSARAVFVGVLLEAVGRFPSLFSIQPYSNSSIPSNCCSFLCLICWLWGMGLSSPRQFCFSGLCLFLATRWLTTNLCTIRCVPSRKCRWMASVFFLSGRFKHLFRLVVHSLCFRRSVFGTTIAVLLDNIAKDWGDVAVVVLELCWSLRRFHILPHCNRWYRFQ